MRISMTEIISPDNKRIIFQLVTPLFLIGFYFFSRFVKQRLPERSLAGWRLFSISGFIVICGLAVAAYPGEIELGAGIMLLGFMLGAIGLIKFLIGSKSNNSTT